MIGCIADVEISHFGGGLTVKNDVDVLLKREAFTSITRSVRNNKRTIITVKGLVLTDRDEIDFNNAPNNTAFNFILNNSRGYNELSAAVTARLFYENIISGNNLQKLIENNIVSINLNYVRSFDYSKSKLLYCDGSSTLNPRCSASAMCQLTWNPNGLIFDEESKLNCDVSIKTLFLPEGTNNTAELSGILLSLETIMNMENKPRIVIITSDSEYSIKSFREWCHNWVSRNWRSSSNGDVLNKELIQKIFNLFNDILSLGIIVSLRWTKGHANQQFNEICDEEAKKELFKGIGK